MNHVQQLFPSEDGNQQDRMRFLGYIEQLLQGTDELKNPHGVNLKGNKSRNESFYLDLIQNSRIPQASIPMEEVTKQLLELLHDHPYHSRYFMTNILPMASIPGIVGMLACFMVNGNNLWDVYGPAAAEAEVKVVSMMSKLVGYDAERSGGYSTWGGQGAIFTGLRMAIAKFAPEAKKQGVPGNLYAFCSEGAHYSLYKSMEATGLGSDRLIKVRTLADSSMDVRDLQRKMQAVIDNGGVPIYVVGTTGTTDAFGIDDLESILEVAEEVARVNGIRRAHIHADSALGGFFAFFNEYDLSRNELGFSSEVVSAVEQIRSRIKHLRLADSLCFDFQKLGQTPYVTSLFLVKDAADLLLLDLEPEETPYVGYRGYGQYHTSYTLECSRMGSSISMYSALLAFGIEGYQRLLAQFIEVNHAIRKAISEEIPEIEVVNPGNPGIITLFRLYPEGSAFWKELSGVCTSDEIRMTNEWNDRLFEALGKDRDKLFFGDTKKHLIVPTWDGTSVALYAAKVFIISPYTELADVEHIVSYLKHKVQDVYQELKQMHNREGFQLAERSSDEAFRQMVSGKNVS